MKVRFAGLLLVLTMTMGFATVASAGLLGVTVAVCSNTSYAGPVTTSTAACDSGTVQLLPASAVVGAGIEFDDLNTDYRRVDFGDDYFSLIYGPGQDSPSGDLFVFSFTGLTTPIQALTLLTANPMATQVAFTGDAIGVFVAAPQCCTTSTTTVTYGISTAVPDPGSTLLLLGMGLAGLGAWRRRWQ